MGIVGNFIDNVILEIAPSIGLKRIHNKGKAKELKKAYAGASRTGRSKNWRTSPTNADAAATGVRNTLRDRSRDLARNNAYSIKAINAIAANVVGPGIRPAIKNKSQEIEEQLKTLWKKWAESINCDFNDNLDFYGIQFQVMRAIVESGEVLILKKVSRSNEVSLELQILEGDHLDESKDVPKMSNGNYIELGIEYNSKGKKVAYHIYKDHPGGISVRNNAESVRIKAEKVIHVFFVERPGQTRGVPFGTAAFDKLREFDEYERAQLVKQKVAACFSAFITNQSDGPIGKTNNEGIALDRVEPGIIEYLAPGEEVSFGTPPTTEGYDIYARKILQQIAAAYGVTYEQMTNDLSNVNFSSGRMGWLEFGKMVIQWQNQLIINKLCREVWKWFVSSAGIKNDIQLNGTNVTWTPPRREMIDPVKETKALVELVRAGFASWQETVRTLGKVPEDLLEQIAQDLINHDKLGLKLSSDARHDPNRPAEEEDEEEKEKDD